MNHGSLATGIGGFDIASEWMGWNNVFQCEIDDFCLKVLEKRFPNAIRHKDIRQFGATEYKGRIDVISAGLPCQPYSISNQAKRDDDSRKLWPEMLRIVERIGSAWVVIENVANFKNMALDGVISDLEAIDYTTETFILPAISVGAIHRRDRIWIVAHSNKKRFKERRHERKQASHDAAQPIQWPTESPICGADDELSSWVDEIATLGNSIVPNVAYEIFKAIDKFEIL